MKELRVTELRVKEWRVAKLGVTDLSVKSSVTDFCATGS